MRTEIPVGSASGGFLCFSLVWDDLPQNAEPSLVFELPLVDGLLALLVLENRLLVEVGIFEGNSDRATDQWITPELIRRAEFPCVISVCWDEQKITCFRINGEEVPGHVDAFEFEVQHKEEETNVPAMDKPIFEFDLRRGPVPISMEFRQLIQFTIRLEAALKELKSDIPEKLGDIANLLRSLLTGKKGKDGGRLLFKCAEEMGDPLICYTLMGSGAFEEPPLDDATVVLLGDGAAYPSGKLSVATMLDDWLEMPALITKNVRRKNWELLRDVADSFGSHGETEGDSILFPLLQRHDAGLNFGILIPVFRNYGNLALELARGLIQKRWESSLGKIHLPDA